MSLEIIGTVFTNKGVEGDFEWQIKSGLYEDSLFIFNDDEKRRRWNISGRGNAIIRKYNRYSLPSRPRSAGIYTGDGKSGYDELTPRVKDLIDECIEEIRNIIKTHKYTKIYYSAKTPNGLLGTAIFNVHPDVIEYITNEIKKL